MSNEEDKKIDPIDFDAVMGDIENKGPLPNKNDKTRPMSEEELDTQKVEIAFSIIEKIKQGETTEGDILSFPSELQGIVRKAFRETTNTPTSESEVKKWLTTVTNGMANASFDSIMANRLTKGNWKQRVPSKIGEMHGVKPKITPIENAILTGSQAARHLQSHLGKGNGFTAPLWHSGIWVTLRPATETEMFELQRSYLNLQIDLGTSTYGLSHSNSVVLSSELVILFILDHITSTTLDLKDVKGDDDLKTILLDKVIMAQDIDTLLWAMQVTLKPDGFDVSRGCVANPNKCMNIETEHVVLNEMQIVDLDAIPDSCVTHMTNVKSKSVSMSEVEAYQSNMSDYSDELVFTGSGDSKIGYILHNIKVGEYFRIGREWIDSLVTMAEASLGKDPKDGERSSYVDKLSKASSMGKYLHYVSEIRIGTNTISDEHTISQNMTDISSSDEHREEFFEHIKSFIEKSSFCIIGVSNYECSACGKSQATEGENKLVSNFVPIDCLQNFFGLVNLELIRVLGRQ